LAVGVVVAGRAEARQTDTVADLLVCSGGVAVADAVVGVVAVAVVVAGAGADVAASAQTPVVPGQPKRLICGEVRGC